MNPVGTSRDRRSVTAPRPPDIPEARRFPVIATLAPVVASVVLFAVTRSAFALAFAALGPVVAVASTLDAAINRRRSRAREEERFARDVRLALATIDAAHHDERELLDGAAPTIHELLARLDDHAQLWRSTGVDEVLVRLGSGRVLSTIDYRAQDFGSVDGQADPRVAERLGELGERARALSDAPILVDARDGIGFVGPAPIAEAAARAVVMQLAILLSPEMTRMRAPDGAEWDWLRSLPHPLERSEHRAVEFVVTETNCSLSVAFAANRGALPREAAVIVELDGAGRGRIIRSLGAPSATSSNPELIGVELLDAEQSVTGASDLHRLALDHGLGPAAAKILPEALELAALASAPSDSNSLVATLGVGAGGEVAIDLVAEGPHAIVGGTTGSGKSELLLSWMLAIAAERPPAVVTFLFVDFKGGAAFDSLRSLPHCVGVITDLDAEQSLRALASLGAELRFRERTLATLGLRSLDDAGESPPFARLVVVVDEYAALVETHSSLHGVFADIASRGRSLGVHLVLCTQRPAGVVRDSILANCALRLSLRVNSPADSIAVIGTDAAAALPARPLGRALASVAGSTPTLFQVARSSAADIARVADRWADSPAPRIPWCPPLPSKVVADPAELGDPADELPFGLADLPEQQRQEPARYRPAEHGSLLVVGGGGSGKSGFLAALDAVPSTLTTHWIATDLPRLWDALVAALDDPDPTPRVFLIDDLDSTVATCPEEYQAALLELLARVLREGAARGVYLVLTAQRVPGNLHGVAALCGSRLILRMPSRHEHVLAGGPPAEFLERASSGAGYWCGHRIQIFAGPPTRPRPEEPRARLIDLAADRLAVVSASPQRCAAELRELAPDRRVTVLEAGRYDAVDGATIEVSSGGAPDILVADPEVWQSQWSLFAALRRSNDLLFDGCSLPEFRALTRSRELPPPFARGERALWLMSPDGGLARGRLPTSP